MNYWTDFLEETMESSNLNTGLVGEVVEKGKYHYSKFFANIKDIKIAKRLNKKAGLYLTINVDNDFWHLENAQEYLIKKISVSIKEMINFENNKKINLLVVGLGNAFLVADSLGAMVVKDLTCTRIFAKGSDKVFCAIIPGVSGINGIETYDIISGVVDRIKPSALLIVDALTTKIKERIGCSFQLSDTGITPGAGIGGNHHTLEKESLGIPCYVLGVPMMLKYQDGNNEMIVTLKEIDIITKCCAKVISKAINSIFI